MAETTLITAAGIAKIAQVSTLKVNWKIKEIAFGSGYYEIDGSETELVGEFLRKPVTEAVVIDQTSNRWEFTTQATSSDGELSFDRLGLFDEDGVLIAITQSDKSIHKISNGFSVYKMSIPFGVQPGLSIIVPSTDKYTPQTRKIVPEWGLGGGGDLTQDVHLHSTQYLALHARINSGATFTIPTGYSYIPLRVMKIHPDFEVVDDQLREIGVATPPSGDWAVSMMFYSFWSGVNICLDTWTISTGQAYSGGGHTVNLHGRANSLSSERPIPLGLRVYNAGDPIAHNGFGGWHKQYWGTLMIHRYL